MTDQYSVDTVKVDELAQSFGSRQAIPARLGQSVSAVRQVSTGDTGLDSQTGGVADAVATHHARITEVLTAAAEWMNWMAAEYRKDESRYAADYRELRKPASTTQPGV